MTPTVRASTLSGEEIDAWIEARSHHERPPPASQEPGRRLNAGAAVLSFSMLADSGLEHYRGGFFNPVMYVAPTVSALALASSASALAHQGQRSRGREAIFAAATLTGLIGTGFHTYNISQRVGGWRWLNLFYGAPLAAPMGVTSAGLLGLAAATLQRQTRNHESLRLLGKPAGPVLAIASALGLLGTAAEAWLFHFRGAFQDPFMYIPVTVPPLAAVALGGAALGEGTGYRAAGALLWATAAAGFAGMGFHAYGIHRNMGGWYNWSQNLLQGPPIPAPPSFTGMALAGLAALGLMGGAARA